MAESEWRRRAPRARGPREVQEPRPRTVVARPRPGDGRPAGGARRRARRLARARGRPRQPRAGGAARPARARLRPRARRRLPRPRHAEALARAPSSRPRPGEPLRLPGPRGGRSAPPPTSAPACARCTSRCGARAGSSPTASTSSCAEDAGTAEEPRHLRPPARTRRRRSRAACASAACGRGDTVALMLPTGLDFLRAFIGILLARAIPVPIYPPVRLDRLEEYAAAAGRRSSPTRACALLVTVPRARPVATLLRPAVPTLADVVTRRRARRLRRARCRRRRARRPTPPSSSTPRAAPASPRASCSRHDNLLANIRAIGAGLEIAPDGRRRELAAALPRHGADRLVARRACTTASRSRSCSPTAFLARPERWLWAIHERRGDAVGRAQLRLRALRPPDPGRRARGPRPLARGASP